MKVSRLRFGRRLIVVFTVSEPSFANRLILAEILEVASVLNFCLILLICVFCVDLRLLLGLSVAPF